ncbi:MAG: hypothetical protein KME32_26970 [Mojavia pulchra JT2-VF2]|uniref:Uncharacterized protein n=1 Tax=Mojavia pulchra JT2-VF2 TaxID=287848 RepID=A0A951Q2F3_9NOST|nr:hypothetical protein [Mojavia pulchra JT2-VF2]
MSVNRLGRANPPIFLLTETLRGKCNVSVGEGSYEGVRLSYAQRGLRE